MNNFKNLIGQKFGRFRILYILKKQPYDKRTKCHCKCDCGNEKDVIIDNLIRGHTKSCGCLNKEILSFTLLASITANAVTNPLKNTIK
jgi:hypothetical protein